MLLHYKSWGEQKGTPLIILHGLLGSLGNWESLARKWSEDCWVIAVDQRNHGKSPHTDSISYEEMSEDLKELIKLLNIESCNLLGHSMGGKAAMVFALSNPELVNKLIVADIMPVSTQQGHQYIFEAMQSMPFEKIMSRNDADDWLSSRIVSSPVRQFILKNLSRTDNGIYEWSLNLKAIVQNYEQLMQFPTTPGKQYLGQTLFIKGELSDYINSFDFAPITRQLFPNAKLQTIEEAGHWLHAEQPEVFFTMVKEFIESVE